MFLEHFKISYENSFQIAQWLEHWWQSDLTSDLTSDTSRLSWQGSQGNNHEPNADRQRLLLILSHLQIASVPVTLTELDSQLFDRQT